MRWQVVRYSALLTGVFYGIVHRRTLQAQEDVKKEKHVEERHEQLLKRAQQAWRDKQSHKKDDGEWFGPVVRDCILLLYDSCIPKDGAAVRVKYWNADFFRLSYSDHQPGRPEL